MANTGVSHAEAKSIVDKLECSPSQHDTHGYNAKPKIHVGNNAHAGKESTDGFKKTDRGKRIAGFSGKFARGARQE